MLDAPRVEIAAVRPAAHIPGCQLAPNHLSLDADEHKFGIEPCSKLDQSICRMLDAICGTMGACAGIPYERWLGSEPDPHDLLITFPSEPMKMWPISKRVNSPRNDDEDLLVEVDLATGS